MRLGGSDWGGAGWGLETNSDMGEFASEGERRGKSRTRGRCGSMVEMEAGG